MKSRLFFSETLVMRIDYSVFLGFYIILLPLVDFKFRVQLCYLCITSKVTCMELNPFTAVFSEGGRKSFVLKRCTLPEEKVLCSNFLMTRAWEGSMLVEEGLLP